MKKQQFEVKRIEGSTENKSRNQEARKQINTVIKDLLSLKKEAMKTDKVIRSETQSTLVRPQKSSERQISKNNQPMNLKNYCSSESVKQKNYLPTNNNAPLVRQPRMLIIDKAIRDANMTQTYFHTNQ